MSFNDIIGQEAPKKILRSQLCSQRIANAYLFYGPTGVGKTLTAITFAKALNCESQGVNRHGSLQANQDDSCDKCQTCNEIWTNRNPDFRLIIPEKEQILIDQIRAIRNMVSYTSIWLKFRVIIIREADRLTTEASNAFLKLLEEPPHRTILVLTTSNEYALLPTIISRCQKIRFMRLKPAEIEQFIGSLNVESPSTNKSISRSANGSIARAIRLLSPEGRELQKGAMRFLNVVPIRRMEKIDEIKSLVGSEFLLSVQNLYSDLLRRELGSPELAKNEEYKFKSDKVKTIGAILNAIITCDKAFHALKQNVHKELILYQLSRELPFYGEGHGEP